MVKVRWIILAVLAQMLHTSAFAFGPHRPHSPELAPRAQNGNFPRGIGVEIHDINLPDSELTLIREAGFDWIRTDFAWNYTEPRPGIYDFANFDEFVKRIQRVGIRPIFILDYTNPLYDQNRAPHSDAGRAAFARWATAAVSHFRGIGAIWEIYNEPNEKFYWQEKPNADIYFDLAITTADAIHAQNPGELVVGPAYATAFTDFKYLEHLFKRGILNHLDAVSLHPYKFFSGPEDAHSDFDTTRVLIENHQAPGSQIPIFVSEQGFSSWSRFSDEHAQAKNYAREILFNQSASIPLTVWYDWKEDPGHSFPFNLEQHFGLTRSTAQGTLYQKPVFSAAKTVNHFLKGFQFKQRFNIGGDGFLLEFRNTWGQSKYAMWQSNAGRKKYSLPLPEGNYEVMGTLGEHLGDQNVGSHGLKYEFGNSPVYFMPRRLVGCASH